MEGLIPFLIEYATKKQKLDGHGIVRRSLSENSSSVGRSYHLLLAGDSVEGSSHRRTRSDIQPPTPRDNFPVGSGSSAAPGVGPGAAPQHRGFNFLPVRGTESPAGRKWNGNF